MADHLARLDTPIQAACLELRYPLFQPQNKPRLGSLPKRVVLSWRQHVQNVRRRRRQPLYPSLHLGGSPAHPLHCWRLPALVEPSKGIHAVSEGLGSLFLRPPPVVKDEAGERAFPAPSAVINVLGMEARHSGR